MKFASRWSTVFGAMLLCVAPAWGAQTNAPAAQPAHAAIASAHKLATEAGFEVLEEGGNAFDAAIAVASTLSVVEPQSSGIGGGGFFLLHRASDGSNVMLDAREAAPSGASSKLYENPDGSPNRDKALNGALAAGIPGEPAALVWLAEHYGKLPLSKSLAPAIRIARNGFQPDARFLGAVHRRADVIARYPASKNLLLPDGKPPEAGWVFRNPDLADTLERLAKHGDAGFYRGEFAKKLVDGVRAAGGDWTLADLANYQVKARKPIAFDYHPPGGATYRIVSASPPSSGGVALEEIFNILSGFDLAKMDKAHRAHTVIEAMRRAYRDRTQYLGDPDFVEMPLERLTSMAYADELRESIQPDKATPSSALPKPNVVSKPESMHTTSFSIIDKDGNMVAVTKTVNTSFGSCLVIPGTGFVLNNEMDDFALVPGKPNAYGLIGYAANAPAPGRRPLSSMTPSFVFGSDRAMTIGSPGGATIITQVLEGILGFIDGDSAEQIVSKPRYHQQYLPDLVYMEPDAFDAKTNDALRDMGYTLKQRHPWGFMNLAIWNRKTGEVSAASDPRGDSGSGMVR